MFLATGYPLLKMAADAMSLPGNGKMHNRLSAIAIGLGLAWSNAATAQDLYDEDDLAVIFGDKATISLATGSQQVLRRAPSVVTVITADDIAAMGATDLDEVLETVPGMHVSRTVGYISSYLIRGISGGQTNPQVLLLQNGVPMYQLYRGDKGGTGRGLPVAHIARIEVIRGPGSALYGADAFGGVINVITKTAADTPGTEVGVLAGSFDTRSAWALHGGKWGALDVATYLNVGGTAGFRRVVDADAQSARDVRFGTQASLAPGPVNTGYDAVDLGLDMSYEKWQMRAFYKQRSDVGIGVGINDSLDPQGRVRGEHIATSLAWHDPAFAERWSVGYAASFTHDTITMETPLLLSPPGSRFSATSVFPDGLVGSPGRKERQLRLSAYATYIGLPDHQVRIGVGHDDLQLYETTTSNNFRVDEFGIPQPTTYMDYQAIQPHILPQRRRLNYLYVQDEWNFAPNWILTAGARYDRFSDVGGTTNPRLALVWDAAHNLTAKLMWGRAFRAPAFIELYGINPVANGNATLKPETIHTQEAALSWQARGNLQFNVNLFRYAMKDVILTVPNLVAGTGSTFQNAGSKQGRGMELEAVWETSRTLRISSHYAYQKSIDEATGQDAGYAPHHHLYGRADWRVAAGWRLSGQINHVADRHRAPGDLRPQIADYTSVDLTVRSDRGRHGWSFSATVRNLFNADVREPSLAPGTAIPNDLPMAPRAIYLQVSHML